MTLTMLFYGAVTVLLACVLGAIWCGIDLMLDLEGEPERDPSWMRDQVRADMRARLTALQAGRR